MGASAGTAQRATVRVGHGRHHRGIDLVPQFCLPTGSGRPPPRSHRRGLVPSSADPLPRPGRPQEEGRRHPPRQPLVGPRSAPPDGRLRRPRVGHLRPDDARLPALHLRRDPALEVVHERDRTTRSRRSSARSGSSSRSNFPKLVLPAAATFAGIANFAFGLIPLFATADPVLPAPAQLARSSADPGRSPSSSSSSRSPSAIVLAAVNVFYPRRRQRQPPRAAPVVLPLAGALLAATRSRRLGKRRSRSWPTLMLLNPFATLFESYRNVIYGIDGLARPTRCGGTWPSCWSSRSCCSRWRRYFFKRVEPAFAKVL